jgi:hypothetical protein
MGKRSAVVELFLGDMDSMQRELRPSIQREDQPIVAVVNPCSPEMNAHVKRIVEISGVSSQCSHGEDHVGIVNLDDTMFELPGVGEGGMTGSNVQRKLGTTRGSPRRSRTAKTSRISRCAVKSRCAHEWGGWGRLSDDGSRQHNSSKSEDPWGSGNPTSWRCAIESTTRHCAG